MPVTRKKRLVVTVRMSAAEARARTAAVKRTDGYRLYRALVADHSLPALTRLVHRLARAVTKAVIPGRQNAKNTAAAEKAALAAARRVMRTHGR